MKNLRNFRFCIWLGFILALAGTLFAQSTPDRVLVVNGKTVDSGLRMVEGHSCVDVETLAQLTNGTFVVDPHRVVLNIPVSNAPAAAVADTAIPAIAAPAAKTAADTAIAEVAAPNGAAPASASAAAVANEAPAPAPPPSGISRQFASVAIAALADMREWRGAIAAMVRHGLAISDAWAAGYRDQAQADLAQAEVAATTDDDRNALQLLRNEESNLESWWDTVLAQRQELNGEATVDPDALKNDPMLAKIRACGQFLSSMLVSGTFSDNIACH